MSPEHLDYVERQAERNYDFHSETYESLRGEARTLLSLLLVLTGAAFGLTADLLARPGVWAGWAVAGAAATAYLAALVVWLALRGLRSVLYAPPANEPKNLLAEGYDLAAIREVELENLQARIEQNVAEGGRLGELVDRVRVAAVATPLVFAAAAALSRCGGAAV